jgi:prolyl oligopeptidase
VEVRDPYRWLEDGDSPEVRLWTEAQGRHTAAVLGAVPRRERLKDRLRALFSIGVITPPAPRSGRYFYQRRTGTQEQPVLYVREGLRGPERVLIDPAVRTADRTSALDWWHPSADGRLVAYGISEGGTEKSVLRVRDVETGSDLDDVIPQTRACALEWWPDGRGFYYTRYPMAGTVPEGEDNYHRQVFRHVLGRTWAEDELVFGGRPPADWPNVHLSPDGRWLAVSVAVGWTRTDVYLKDLSSSTGFVTVAEGEDALYGVDVRNDRLLLHTNKDAPRYRLVEADLEAPGPASWRDLIPQGPDVLQVTGAVGRSIVAVWLRDASSRVTVHDARGALSAEIPLPMIGTVSGLTGEWDGDEAFLGFTSFTLPPVVYRIPLPGPHVELWERVEADVDTSTYRVRLVRYPSKDGTWISMFLVDRADRAPDGRGRAVLTGYGGFNVSHTPAFARSILPFLDEGGLYAVAHLRGGGEYGEEWHRAGMLGRKQNVFDDYLAAADHLVATGEVAPDRLAGIGGSNGGLLMGAALVQRPERFRAIVSQVPLLDMLRYHLFRIAKLWIPEYGSPDDPEAFRWLAAYSPYHHVRDDAPYPAVLLTTGESDSRVDPMHARKMAARLQQVPTARGPILLRVESRAGHGQGKPISKVVDEWTDVWTFLFEELG